VPERSGIINSRSASATYLGLREGRPLSRDISGNRRSSVSRTFKRRAGSESWFSAVPDHSPINELA